MQAHIQLHVTSFVFNESLSVYDPEIFSLIVYMTSEFVDSDYLGEESRIR